MGVHVACSITWLWACNEKYGNVVWQNYSATPDRHYISSDDLHWLIRSKDSTACHTYCTVPSHTHTHKDTDRHTQTHTHTETKCHCRLTTYPLWRVSVRHSQRPARLRSGEERPEIGEDEHVRQSLNNFYRRRTWTRPACSRLSHSRLFVCVIGLQKTCLFSGLDVSLLE